MRCRNCDKDQVDALFCNLGAQPLANEYIGDAELDAPQIYYPLAPMMCGNCGLIQLDQLADPESIFEEYAYFSSQSAVWVKHVQDYAINAAADYGLSYKSRVLEIASNDGATLRAFRGLGIPALGIEPAENIAQAANLDGLATIPAFMGYDFAGELLQDGFQADLIVANNVLAHVPDLDDFLRGIELVLAKEGVLTVEFPDATLIAEHNTFDTIYHEHYSYFTADTAADALRRRGLDVFKIERLPIHGGSIRLHARRQNGLSWRSGANYDLPLGAPDWAFTYYHEPQEYKRAFLEQLINWADRGLVVAGYGAPAKGNTLLNYCGVGTDLISYVVDSTPEKQGKYLPGSRIPIHDPRELENGINPPDVIIIMPWNWTKEISAKLDWFKAKGGILMSRLGQV